MSALSQKETRRLLHSLEVQGALVTKAKKGMLVRFPNGTVTSIHWSNSDHRSTLNMRAAVKRAGLQWPFDHQQREKRMALHLTQERRDRLSAIIADVGDNITSASAIAAKAEVSDPTAKTALIQAGFVQEKRGQWSKPVVEEEKYPNIFYAKTVVKQPEPAVVETAQERAFIDDADSWTIPVPDKLQAMADLMGLNIEVRVWRTKS